VLAEADIGNGHTRTHTTHACNRSFTTNSTQVAIISTVTDSTKKMASPHSEICGGFIHRQATAILGGVLLPDQEHLWLGGSIG